MTEEPAAGAPSSRRRSGATDRPWIDDDPAGPLSIRRRLRSWLLRGLLAPLQLLAAGLPLRWALALGARLGDLARRFAHRDRRRALEHLALALPELTATEREGLAQQAFRHWGMLAVEVLRLRRSNCDEVRSLVEFEGWENVEAARADARPILILTGHCGNWELLSAAINCRGLPLFPVAQRLRDPFLHEAIVDLRRRFGAESVVRGDPGASRLLLRTLRSGGALGMLIDQDTRVDGVWVPFFGCLAYTPVGAAEIALRYDAQVLPVFIERRPDGTHLARVLSALELPGDEVGATAAMTRAIEEQIRRRPAEWVWMHKRWRRRPPADSGEAGRAASLP